MSSTRKESPTTQFYDGIQFAFKYFNKILFDDSLPEVMLTLQRQKQVMGYFSPERWGSADGDKCHEIAINPSYIARSSVIEYMQTLVHEMTHLWQRCFGSPGRTCYHNKEWARKMISIGLMPTDTGRTGGKVTGDHMNDYPVKDGRFLKSCIRLIEDEKFALKWVDRFAKYSTYHVLSHDNYTAGNFEWSELEIDYNTFDALTSPMSQILGEADIVEPLPFQNNVKTKFVCNGCAANAWGKATLNLICGDCDLPMAGISPANNVKSIIKEI